MKRVTIVLLSSIIIVMACGKKTSEPRYEPGSKEYDFFKTLSEKAPILNPNESNELISTKEFSIYTADIMPVVYMRWSRSANSLDKISSERVLSFVHQVAAMEAEKKLMLAAAQQNNITVIEDTVQAELQKIYAHAGGEEAYLKRIETQGISPDFFKNDIRDRLTVQKYLDDMVYGQIEVTEEELRKTYGEDKTATVRHILLKTQNKSDSEKQEILGKTEEILARARGGEDFAGLAKQYSEDEGSKNKGGLYENFERGRMVKPFEEASFNLPIGSISDPVETTYGYHIIQIISRSKETRPFEQVKNEIDRKLNANKKREAYRNMLDSLKEEYEYKELFTA